jgi:hypothetical protein
MLRVSNLFSRSSGNKSNRKCIISKARASYLLINPVGKKTKNYLLRAVRFELTRFPTADVMDSFQNS